MKKWFNSSSLTGLPGLPGSSRAILLKAKRENWKWRKHKGLGGGKEFHYSSLPDETRAHLAAAEMKAKASKAPSSPRSSKVHQLSAADLRHALRELSRIQEKQEALLVEGKRLVASIVSSIDNNAP